MAIKYNPPKQKTVKSYQEYLADLENLLKRNTGQGLYVGQDVSSNTPMYLPGKVRNPGGIGELAPSIAQAGNGMTQMDQPERQAIQEGEVLGETAPTIEDFLSSWEVIYNNPEPSIQAVGSTSDGGTIGSDGNIYYEDGTMRQGGDPNAFANASTPDGVQYSDGTVRIVQPYEVASMGFDEEGVPLLLYSDGTIHYGAKGSEQGDSGLEGLVSGIFGMDRTITQDYGNINPIEPTPGNVNYGTDIRTRDLSGTQRMLKLPVDAEIVQIFLDDGTQFGTQSGHQGYGNSMLVRLPTGEMLRFSHLSQIANLQPGDILKAGQVIGTPGTTGNTAGEHLDLEYYNQDGQVSNPTKFSGFTQPENFRTAKSPGTQVPQEVAHQLGRVENSSTMTPAPQPMQSVPQVAPKTAGQLFTEDVSKIATPVIEAAKTTLPLANPFKSREEKLAIKPASDEAITKAFGTNPEGTAGIQELMMGDLPAAVKEQSQTAERIGTKTNAPELNVGEVGRGELPIGQVLSATRQYLGIKPTGLRNAIDQGTLAPKTMAYEPGSQEEINQNLQNPRTLKGDIQSGITKAGEGIKSLASNAVSSLENVFKPKQDPNKRMIGDVSGTGDPMQSGQFSSVMDTASSMASLPKNDIRDPFFKMGGADMFKSFLAPGIDSNYNGALGLDTFNNEFYKDLGNISSVFGGSKDLGSATDKYIANEKAKYPMMSKISGGEGYDQGQVEEYNRKVDEYNNSLNSYFGSILGSVSSSPSIFTPRASGSAKNVFASPAKVVAPVLASAPKATFSAPQASASRPSAPQMSSSQSRPSAPALTKSSPIVSYATGNIAKQISQPAKVAQPAPVYKPAANLTQLMRQTPTPQSQPSSNIFTKAKTAISNIFRRK